MEFRSFLFKAKTFMYECARVLKITKKPSKVEFKTIIKASALGMAIIGLIGFIVTMLRQLMFR